MKATDARAVAALDVPENFRIGLDLTTSGTAQAYDLPATAAYLADQPYTRRCVEYPANEAARFPINLLTPGTVVALGVVDVSSADLDDVDDLVARIDEAATIVNIDDIAISTNGAPTTPAKLQLVEMTARYFWGNEL
jgi:5-methyltetrahydropteroyltriglutamate--homocysteine methyltransferase